MHKKIIENALSLLDQERAAYFGSIANSLEEDNRINDSSNIIYSVLKDIMVELPIYLDKKIYCVASRLYEYQLSPHKVGFI